MVDFVPIGRAILRQPAKRISLTDITSTHIQRVCQELHDFASGRTVEDRHGVRLVGIAAPQVGIDLAIVYVDMATPNGWTGNLRLMINPRILRQWGDAEPVKRTHGCYSTGDFVTVIELPRYMEVRYYDAEGSLHTWTIDGVVDGARLLHAVWHEIRHIDGQRHTDMAVNHRWPIYVVRLEDRVAFTELYVDQGRTDMWPTILPPMGWAAAKAGRSWRGLVVERQNRRE